MSRKTRKQKRKQKQKRGLNFIKKAKLTKEEDQFCRSLGRAMAKMRPDKDVVNKKYYCPVGLHCYCLGFDGTYVYKDACFYKDCCQKEIAKVAICKKCEGGLNGTAKESAEQYRRLAN